MRMDLQPVKKEDFLPRKFEVISSTVIEEYILGDQQILETSLSQSPQSPIEQSPIELEPDLENLSCKQELLQEGRNLNSSLKSEGEVKILVGQLKKDKCSVDCLMSGYCVVKQSSSIERHKNDKTVHTPTEVSKMFDTEENTSSYEIRSTCQRKRKKNRIENYKNVVPQVTQKNNAELSSQILVRKDSEVDRSAQKLEQSNSISFETINNLSSFKVSSEISVKNNIESNKREAFCNIKKISGIDRRIINCGKCSNKFCSVDLLQKHMSAIHPKEPKQKLYVCKDCGKAYTQDSALKYHIFSIHNPSKDKCKCMKCRRYFSNREGLNHHLRRAHLKTEVDVPEICDICQKFFPNRIQMRAHRTRQHNPHGKIFICNDCSEEFTERNRLIYHIKRSHMAPEVKCSLCNEYFLTTGRRRTHLMNNHGKYNEKPHTCETCGKQFKSSVTLKNHILTHSDAKLYVCEECGKRFKTDSNLKQHSQIHSDVRPFECDLCGKAFRIRHHLRQHMVVHGMVSTSNYNKRRKQVLTTSEEEEDDCA